MARDLDAGPDPTVVRLETARPPELAGRIVFDTDRLGRRKLFTVDAASGAVAPLTEGPDHHDEGARWSPDGTRVAFATTRFDSRTYELAVMDVAVRTVHRVTTELAFDRHPAWSPDGRRLFFSSERDGTQAVFQVELASLRVTRTAPPPDRSLMPDPALDGRRLAYTLGTPDGLQIAVQELPPAGVPHLVTHAAEGAARPRWSADGRRLAYERLRREGTVVEILDQDSGRVSSYAIEGFGALAEPSWSPDGRWLVAAGATGEPGREDWDLIVLQPAPTPAAFRLTEGAGNDRAPSWSPQ